MAVIRVKICSISSPGETLLAVEYGATAPGRAGRMPGENVRVFYHMDKRLNLLS